MPDQRECDQLRNKIEAIGDEMRAGDIKLWDKYNEVTRLISGNSIEGGIIGAINRFDTILKYLQESDNRKSRQAWSIILLLLAQIIGVIIFSLKQG